MTTLGIDLGTGSVKAAIVDDEGRVTGRASHPYRVRSPRPGCAEGDPREWLHAAAEVAASVTTGVAQRPIAVAFSGQMHGVVVTDKDLKPLRPAILWADARATVEARELAEALSPAELSRLGSPAVTGFAATSIAWLLRHEPDVMAKAVHILQPKDWLRAAMGGGIATDPSDASGTLLYDVVSGAWSDEALAWLGTTRDLRPGVRSSTDAAGHLRVDGWGGAVPSVVGAADTACALAGLGLGGEALLAPAIHRIGLALAIGVGAVTLVLGVVRHGDPVPLQVGAAGIAFMAVALFVGHGSAEAVLTILGVSLLAWAHLRNLRCHH